MCSGRKRFEGRRYWGDVRSWKEGDTLEVFHVVISRDEEGKVRLLDGGEPSFSVRVVGVKTYANFEEALKDLWQGGTDPLDQVLPRVTSIAEGLRSIGASSASRPRRRKGCVCSS